MSKTNRIPESISTALLASLLIVGASSGLTEQQGSLPGLFRELVEALKKGAQFVGQEFSSFNVDGLTGIRICQSVLIQTVQDCETGQLRCPVSLIETLNNVTASLQESVDKSLPYVEGLDEHYYNRFLPLFNAPFFFDWSLKSLGNTSSARQGSDGVYRGHVGDRCISLMLGTDRDDEGNKLPMCSVTEECLNLMTKPNKKAYALTHQLLYLVITEKFGCLDQMQDIFNKYGKGSVKDLDRRLSQSVYVEVKGEVNGSTVEEIRRDLFLEQELIGCLLGFREFFQEKWIRMVLKWQKTGGCFGLSFLGESDEDYGRILSSFKRRNDNPTGRKLMSDVRIRDDCSSHSTGLGLGTIALYLRYYATQLFDQQSSFNITFPSMT